MRVSLLQVAKRAGVSGATVSRVLNGVDVRIAPETRRKVLRVAAEMGYQVNRTARALVTGRTQTVALWGANLRNPHYARVIDYTQAETERHNYDLLISGVYHWPPEGIDTSKILSWPVDGILAVDMPVDRIPGLEKSLLGGKPFVALGAYRVEKADSVRVDFTAQVEAAVHHLASVGCRRIAYLVPDRFDEYRQKGEARLQGYETAMARLAYAPEYVLMPDQQRRNVSPVLRAYLARNGCPDGIFCFNDNIAMGAFRTLRDLGLRVPEDVALVGCDGIEETEYADPPLTTIVQPLEEMCAIAWNFLAQRMQDLALPLQKVTVQPTLTLRRSSQH